jgi:serine/threonine protein kinase
MEKNILLDRNLQICKVCDFGTANFVANATLTGNIGVR